MRLDPNLLNRLPPISRRPCDRWLGFWVRIHVQPDRLERLRNPRYYGGSLVVSELLAETDTRACVEREEYEWVGNEVLLDSLIQEAVWIEFERCGRCVRCKIALMNARIAIPVGPQRSALRCINQGE